MESKVIKCLPDSFPKDAREVITGASSTDECQTSYREDGTKTCRSWFDMKNMAACVADDYLKGGKIPYLP